MLLLCILGLGEKRNTPAPPGLIPPIVATIVLGIAMSMSANCGGAINPARDLGPRLFTLTAGWGVEVFTYVSNMMHETSAKRTTGSKITTGSKQNIFGHVCCLG